MRTRAMAWILLASVLIGLSWIAVQPCGFGQLRADEPPKAAEPGTLVVIDQAGKEHKLKTWKIVAGTRHLSWLAPAMPVKEEPKTKEKEPGEKQKPVVRGPEALEFREEKSTNYAVGILTFIPLDRIRSLDYDNEKRTVTVRVATSAKPEEDEQLTGSTKYQGENQLAIEAEVDKGEMGIADIKFLGGIAKGIRGIRFPAPKVPEMPAAGKTGKVTANEKEKEKTVHQITDPQVLYRLPDGSERGLPTLMFKKTLKVDLAKLKRLKVIGAPPKEGAECEIAFKDGEEQTLTMLKTIPFEEKTAFFEGILGRVKAGYKLFPIHTVAELQLDEGKE